MRRFAGICTVSGTLGQVPEIREAGSAESGPGADRIYGGAGADGLIGGLPGPTFLYGIAHGRAITDPFDPPATNCKLRTNGSPIPGLHQ